MAQERAPTRHHVYTKAVEQLGSADAAVRLGGLYAATFGGGVSFDKTTLGLRQGLHPCG